MAWWLNLPTASAPANSGTLTAQQSLGVPRGFGNWITGDVRPKLSGVGRTQADLAGIDNTPNDNVDYYYAERDL